MDHKLNVLIALDMLYRSCNDDTVIGAETDAGLDYSANIRCHVVSWLSCMAMSPRIQSPMMTSIDYLNYVQGNLKKGD